jgi:hypothetical protein
MGEHKKSIGESSEWYTPKSVFDALGLVFDLDPCSPGPGLCYVPARHHFTAADDGLTRSWIGYGSVFMNPPFGGRRGQVPWLHKFFEHGSGIALVTSLTSSDWFHGVLVPGVIAVSGLLCFPKGKTKFLRPDGSIGKEPGNGIVLIGIGGEANTALLRSQLGVCLRIIVP